MYKVAVLINENEMAHSAFANTPRLLSEISYIQEHKEDYRFVVFDKFNIADLFSENGSNHLMSFDSLFISTNATNNSEILNALRNNKDQIGKFVLYGKGLFVSSQKKLSCKESESIKFTSFLLDKYDYAIIDRPEKSSADGEVSILSSVAGKNPILSYPNFISENLIQDHCEHNSFMQHKYRSFVVPKNESQYLCLLADTSATVVPDALKNCLDKSRKLLLCSGKDTERVVVSTMALDWAGHKELLENILIYITEGVSNFAFVLKDAEAGNSIIYSYILRAKVGKISYREYIDPDITDLLHSPQNIFVFSPQYSKFEVTKFICQAQGKQRLISVYHLVDDAIAGKGLALYHYTNETSVDRIRDEAINWVTRNFYPFIWGKSVWSYNYALSMLSSLGFDYSVFLPVLYDELSNHFCKKGVIDGSYDRVINATCNMLEILSIILNAKASLDKVEIIKKHPVDVLKTSCEEWLVNALSVSRCSKYDKLYVLLSLYRTGYIEKQPLNVRSQFNADAYNTIIIHENDGFSTQSAIVLCQILYLVKELMKCNGITKAKANDYTKQIIDILIKKQDEYGQWGNISETSEVVLSLLEIELDKNKDGYPFLDMSGTMLMITSSIERLFQTYDKKTCCWYDDINTTVKAVHAICLYDRAKNYSANDFFRDISAEYNRLIDIQFINQDTRTLSTYIRAIYDKEQSIIDLREKNEKLKLFRAMFFGTLISFIGLSVLTALIVAGLINEVVAFDGQEISVLQKMFNDWQTEFIFSFLGIFFGALFTGIYSFIKKKTFY